MNIRQSKLFFFIFGLAATSVIIIFIVVRNDTRNNTKRMIERVRKKAKHDLEQSMKDIEKRDKVFRTIDFLIQENDIIAAKQMIDSVLDSNHDDKIYFYRGLLFAKKNNHAEAILDYNRAMRLQEYPTALHERAKSFIILNRLNDAVVDYFKASSINPDYFKELGDLYYTIGKSDSAKEFYKKFLSIYPNDTVVLMKFNAIK